MCILITKSTATYELGQPQAHGEHGFSLIEVLASIIILGLGVLGAAALQLSTLRSNQFTAQASVATQLVRDYQEIAQLIRSSDVSSSEGTTALSQVDTDTTTTQTITNCQATGATCNSAALLGFMLEEWKTRVKTDLPGGRAVVCRDSTPKEASGSSAGLFRWTCDNQGDMLMVKIGWTGRSDRTDKTQQDIEAASRPKVVMTVFGNQQDFTD